MSEQRLIVAGSRTITNIGTASEQRGTVSEYMGNYIAGYGKFTLISGTAPGVDSLAEGVAKIRGIAIERYPANWNRDGNAAGYRRNVQMAETATALLAIWDGKSKGTKHMIDIAIEQRLSPIVIHIIPDGG